MCADINNSIQLRVGIEVDHLVADTVQLDDGLHACYGVQALLLSTG